jgi:ADP-heptose:LPS heptosyltransferase
LDFKRILIFRIGHLGDTIVALPSLWAVRNAFPEAEITLLSNADVKNPHYISARSVLPESGLIDRWESYPTNLAVYAAPFHWARLLLRLRKRKYDALFYLMPRSRSLEQIERDRKFFRLAGIANVIGADYLRSNTLGTRVPNPTPRIERESEFLLNLLSSEGITNSSTHDTSLLLTSDEVDTAQVWIRAHDYRSDRLIGIAPGSKWESKIWPEDRFIAVVTQLIGKFGVFPVVLGGTEDRERGDRMIRAWGKGANAAGHLSVRQSAALLTSCDLYLGNDTGTMHLAAAVGTPCVASFAAIDWVGKWEPFGTGHTVFRRAVECEGCHSPVCFYNNKCLDLIKPQDVLAACENVLDRRPAVHNLV